MTLLYFSTLKLSSVLILVLKNNLISSFPGKTAKDAAMVKDAAFTACSPYHPLWLMQTAAGALTDTDCRYSALWLMQVSAGALTDADCRWSFGSAPTRDYISIKMAISIKITVRSLRKVKTKILKANIKFPELWRKISKAFNVKFLKQHYKNTFTILV